MKEAIRDNDVRPGHDSRLLLGLSCVGFFALGLPDGVIGVAWPSIRADFNLRIDALGALLVASTAGYVISSAASGRVLRRIGVGTLLALSCAMTALALCGYALAGSWLAIIALGVMAGLGAGAIDAGINLYAATNHSGSRLGLLHAGYGLGTIAGPAIMTRLLMAGSGWRAGYEILGGAQIALALCFAASRARWPAPPETERRSESEVSLAHTLRLRPMHLGIASFLLYVGIEAGAGAWIYSLLTGVRGVSMANAGAAVSLYWAGLVVGRIWLSLAPASLAPAVVLRRATLGLAFAAFALAFDLGAAGSMVAVASLGLAAGPIFPSLIAATPGRLPSAHAANAVGISVAAAAAGQSLVPGAIGLAADGMGLDAIPWVLAGATVLLCAVQRSEGQHVMVLLRPTS